MENQCCGQRKCLTMQFNSRLVSRRELHTKVCNELGKDTYCCHLYNCIDESCGERGGGWGDVLGLSRFILQTHDKHDEQGRPKQLYSKSWKKIKE